jgi:hypothetical protein
VLAAAAAIGALSGLRSETVPVGCVTVWDASEDSEVARASEPPEVREGWEDPCEW